MTDLVQLLVQIKLVSCSSSRGRCQDTLRGTTKVPLSKAPECSNRALDELVILAYLPSPVGSGDKLQHPPLDPKRGETFKVVTFVAVSPHIYN